MTSQGDRNGALEAIDRILNRGGDADEVLRAVLQVLFQLYGYVGMSFVEDGKLTPGPTLGERQGGTSTFPIAFNGAQVAELEVASDEADDRDFLERVALVVSPYALVGWDTAGEEWTP